jgi:hypothetical protein
MVVRRVVRCSATVITGASPAGAACSISTLSITSRVRVTCAGGWRVGHLAHA